MNILKQVRTSMHISQEQLAQYLGYSRAYISLTESEQRNLPTGCWVKLLKLYNLINKMQKEGMPRFELYGAAKFPAGLMEMITIHIKDSTEALNRMQKNYDHMRSTYLQYSFMSSIIMTLMRELPDGREGQKDKVWLELLEMDVNEKIELNSEARQTVLQLKIEGLKYELVKAKELMMMKVE